MASILDLINNHGTVRRFDTGEIIIEEGTKTGLLFFLIEGAVEVLKGDMPVATASEPGVVFGEQAALLGIDHTATVRALRPCTFRIVENPRAFLEASPQVCLHVCELSARRLDALTKYLVDVRQQFGGHDHIGLVDGVLETLLHRHPGRRTRPSESTIRQIELAE